jgi:SM-20-related protein
MQTTTPATIEKLLDGIATEGYVIIPDFLSPETIATLREETRQLQGLGEMHRASTGQSANPVDDSIRGDFIHWLEESSASAMQRQYLQTMETLRQGLNQSFYLGLFELESHFAIYPPGAIYRKHLDQFAGLNPEHQHRQVTCILYLNETWQHEYGGQLRMYLNGLQSAPYLDVEPTGGTMVAFLSGRFHHEVLEAKRERMSLTGWFKTRSDQLA